jgi:hypothetical protein
MPFAELEPAWEPAPVYEPQPVYAPEPVYEQPPVEEPAAMWVVEAPPAPVYVEPPAPLPAEEHQPAPSDLQSRLEAAEARLAILEPLVTSLVQAQTGLTTRLDAQAYELEALRNATTKHREQIVTAVRALLD